MAILATILSQVLLTLNPAAPAVPLRFGFPLPADKLNRGLRVAGPVGVRMQWRPLQRRPDPHTGRVWIEFCVTGAHGKVKILAGGAGPVDRDGGEVARFQQLLNETPERRTRLRRWHWGGGVVDTVRRIEFRRRQVFTEQLAEVGAEVGARAGSAVKAVGDPGSGVAEPGVAGSGVPEPAGPVFGVGEAVTLGYDPVRFTAARISSRSWRRAGVLPPGGRWGREYRTRLLNTLSYIVELDGLRDAGDYRRGKGVMTNLEFDTALAFARLGLAEERPGLLNRAWRSACHSVDHDLDARSDLQFPHGPDHRTRAADPGHTWLAGILLAGCLAADEHLIRSAGRIALGLARHPPQAEGFLERVREVGWPLLEMETWLRYADDPEVERAVAALVRRLVSKWNARNHLFEFGEGRRNKGVYYAPLWVTAGTLLPGLRAYHARTGDQGVVKLIHQSERRIADLVRNGRPGLPVRYLIADGKVLRDTRIGEVPSTFLLLEGLSPALLRRCLDRSQTRDALHGVPRTDDPDFVTSWTMVGRCWWIYRAP